MLFGVNRHFITLLFLGLQNFVIAKFVPVITFKTNNVSLHSVEKIPSNQPLEKAQELSFCFRLMPRYHRRFSLIKTDQLELFLRGSENKYVFNLNFEPINGSSNGFSRMMPFCGTFQPGKWFSLCISIEFFELKQNLAFFLDGKKCFDEIFSVTETHWMYYRSNQQLPELYVL